MIIDFKDKVAVITGSARGIGKNIARQFASAGAAVVIVDIDETKGKQVEQELILDGYKAEYISVDLSDAKHVESMIDSLFQKYSHVDILVNNARGGKRTLPLQDTEENCQAAFDVGIKAPLFASQ